MEEQVLVVRSSVVEGLGDWLGLTTDVQRYLPSLLDPRNLLYMRRSQAEQDFAYKQLVPYAVLVCDGSAFTYRRGSKGGESRLHDLWSVGVGGHICSDDGEVGTSAYEAGFRRELAEEVELGEEADDRIVGLLHDPRTPVGRVHVGVVHWIDLTSPVARPRDASMVDGAFRTFAEIRAMRDRFESWSQFVLDGIADY